MALHRTEEASSLPNPHQPATARMKSAQATKLPKPMDVRVPNKADQAGAYAWPERFFVRRILPRDWENAPWLKARVEDVAQSLEDPEEEDLVHSLRTEENWFPDKFRVDSLTDILRGATLRQLEKGDDGVPETKVALLIDSNNIDSDPVFRPFLGSLSAREFLREAIKPRYADDDPSADGNDFIEAERRLIYMVDLDAWAILALLGSSPESLYRQVTEFIHNYLFARCNIGVSFATQGPDTFLLHLSLPVRAFRTTIEPKIDDRKNASNEEPLRSSTDITFLRRLSDARFDALPTDVIYSSHMSAMVTGYDQHRWTGLALLESWFEDLLDDPSPDMMARYENDLQDGLVSDPLCRGRNDATRSEWEPRHYFICVLEVRLNHVYGEWNSTYVHLERIIKAAPKKHEELLRRLKELLSVSYSSTARREAQREADDFETNVSKADAFLRDLAQVLEETLSSASIFMKTDVNYFLHRDGGVGDVWDCLLPLSQIRRTLNNLSLIHQRLGDLQRICKSMIEDGIAERKKFVLQLKMNGITQPVELRVLSWTTIMSQPLLNIAAVFSCDGIITFPRTWYYFLCGFFLMVAAMGSIVVSLLKLIDSGASLFQGQTRDKSPTERSGDGSPERQVATPVDISNPLPPRRSTFCTSGMGHFQKRRGGDIGLLDLPGRSMLGQPAAMAPGLSKPPAAILATRHSCPEPLASER
ncbi:hypothetical protein CPAR01_00344 [Colletotrichum paranaense]|uniref:CorA-like Mg2+ transporter n=1 Tax=Colletotrichum paranaense TaxID=1914294 RepID=A0ABQ9T3K9_9PEZI|nr:uncharacterized protein CPAR01_00344 [Colletotrichum paranaense]KAK1546377.1 hypothetical protein CPAR01_00344 [Colletotrichum paranaense]